MEKLRASLELRRLQNKKGLLMVVSHTYGLSGLRSYQIPKHFRPNVMRYQCISSLQGSVALGSGNVRNDFTRVLRNSAAEQSSERVEK